MESGSPKRGTLAQSALSAERRNIIPIFPREDTFYIGIFLPFLSKRRKISPAITH